VRPLPDQIALGLGQRAEDVDDEHATEGGVDLLGERLEVDRLQLGLDLDEKFEGATESIEALDKKGVAGAQIAENFIQDSPVSFRSAGRLGVHLAVVGFGGRSEDSAHFVRLYLTHRPLLGLRSFPSGSRMNIHLSCLAVNTCIERTVADQIAEGRRVVTCITVRGTRQGELLDIPRIDRRR
jgi:hypothetical protein